jgi:hypothetical protein
MSFENIFSAWGLPRGSAFSNLSGRPVKFPQTHRSPVVTWHILHLGTTVGEVPPPGLNRLEDVGRCWNWLIGFIGFIGSLMASEMAS